MINMVSETQRRKGMMLECGLFGSTLFVILYFSDPFYKLNAIFVFKVITSIQSKN